MGELFTQLEVESHLKSEVAAAGGAKRWLRKHKLSGFDHVLHMIEDGRGATLDRILPALGLRKVIRYEAIDSPDAAPANAAAPSTS